MNAHSQHLPATLRNLSEVVAEYETKRDGMAESIAAFEASIRTMQSAATIGGSYVGEIVRSMSAPSERTALERLLQSAWRHVYDGLNIGKIATAKDRSQFDLALQNPPPFTIDNLRATFGHYVKDPRHHILKGLAECFCGLDPAYRSHSKVKIGVAGLPKRVILNAVGDYGWGMDRLTDMINALNTYCERPMIGYNEIRDLVKSSRNGKGAEYHGLTIYHYKNGNAHVIFSPDMLLAINRALAEFYGDTLPDMPEENSTRRASTEVAKDLAYYPTPVAVTKRILQGFSFSDGETVLEPSCGDGRILDEIRKLRQRLICTGVEVDPSRIAQARAKGHHVHAGNFLQVAPTPTFNYVIMNPPFSGRHYRKHLDHAIKFLAPKGHLVCILPASAHYDHGDLPDGEWHDLPVGSFSESGTNVPTGYLTIYKRG